MSATFYRRVGIVVGLVGMNTVNQYDHIVDKTVAGLFIGLVAICAVRYES